MTALAVVRDTVQIGGPIVPSALACSNWPVAAETTIYAGGMVGLDSSGNAGPASSTFYNVQGRAEQTVINTAAAGGTGLAGAKRIDALPGVFSFNNGDSIAATDEGAALYIGDDNTVFKAPSASAGVNKPFLGICRGMNGTQVKAAIGPVFNAGAARGMPQPLASLPAFAAGTMAPATLVHDAIYDVPTTAANSTIVLPAAAPIGTRVTFCADGTKNGHTVTYVDATGTVSLTAAATASKRHQCTAIKESVTIWTAALAISP